MQLAVEATSPPLGTGTWYAHLRAIDQAGNASETVHLGPFLIDTQAACILQMTALVAQSLTNQPELPPFSWPPASDDGELAGYFVYWGDEPSPARRMC